MCVPLTLYCLCGESINNTNDGRINGFGTLWVCY